MVAGKNGLNRWHDPLTKNVLHCSCIIYFGKHYQKIKYKKARKIRKPEKL